MCDKRIRGPVFTVCDKLFNNSKDSGSFFDTHQLGPSTRVSKNAPEFTGRELGPWTLVVETRLDHANGSRASIAFICVCDFICNSGCDCMSVCLSVCPHDKTETAETKITKLGTGTVIMIPRPPFNQVKRSKGQNVNVNVNHNFLTWLK